MTDNLDKLVTDLMRIDSGWIWHENPQTGALAIFPTTAKDPAAWERRALDMHDLQRPVMLQAKPEENGLARVVRGD